jgi:hypothetical protein
MQLSLGILKPKKCLFFGNMGELDSKYFQIIFNALNMSAVIFDTKYYKSCAKFKLALT